MFLKSLKQPKQIKRNTFEWSLSPLILCMKFVSGCILNVSEKRSSKALRYSVPVLGLFYVIAHFFINGPCALFSENANWEKQKALFKNSKFNKNDLAFFASDFIKISLFLLTLLIHLIFMVNVLLTKKWGDLWLILKKIQREMKLDEVFHCRIRSHCVVALSFLILV